MCQSTHLYSPREIEQALRMQLSGDLLVERLDKFLALLLPIRRSGPTLRPLIAARQAETHQGE